MSAETDGLVRELRKIAAGDISDCPKETDTALFLRDKCSAAATALTAAQAEIAALRKDAERYRHLRNYVGPNIGSVAAHVRVYDGYHFFINGEKLDAAIDASKG